METQKYKLRCRNKGIVVSSNPELFDIVWIRYFNHKIYSQDG